MAAGRHPGKRVPPSDADLHYFHCLRIVEILKGTEASTKNLFGRYSSQRMKVSTGLGGTRPAAAGVSAASRTLCFLLPPQDWQEIVSLYEKENTYLGKAALAAGRLRRALWVAVSGWLSVSKLG